MKKMSTLLAGTALALLLAAANAGATQVPPDGYNMVNAPFWTPTDSTTPPSKGNSNFQLQFEDKATFKDASFGLFTVSDITNPADPTKLEVFAAADEPSYQTKTVSFRENGGQFQVSLDQTNWTNFNRSFGFYFDFVNTNNTKQNNTYYSYAPLDTDGDSVLNVLTAKDRDSQVLIYLDREGTPADESIQMVVGGNDLAPVPEPGTMMLLGAGFLGLAIYGKRRRNA